MNRPRIYIVEDEALIAMEICDRLTHLGYDVCGKATRGEQALDEIPRLSPDIVLMDIRLADKLTGIETAAKLRQLLDLPVVYLTAFSDTRFIEEAIGTEPFGYLLKPFEERELHATLQAALYKHRMEQRQSQARTLENQLQIAGSIAHEFNNLLQVIAGHLTLAQMAVQPENRSLTNNLDTAMQAAQTAAGFTEKLLVYTGKSRAELRPTDLNEIVRTYSVSPPLPLNPHHRLLLNLGEGIPSIMANDQQIVHLLDQLVTNSSESTGDGPATIRLNTGVMEYDDVTLARNHMEGTASPGTYAYVEVADDGCGMDAATLRQAFNLFFTTKFVGRGLGLPAVRGIVQSHGGCLFVTSHPGLSTTVRILFPLTDMPRASTHRSLPQQSQRDRTGSAQTLLVVDDAATVRLLSQEALELYGYRVLAAESGPAALALFREHQDEIDGILLDLSMPGMDGVQTFEALQQINPDAKVLLVSGYHPDALRQQYGEKGFRGFLKKPFQLSELREAVEKLLHQA